MFRENALKRFNSPENLQSTLKVIQPRAWMWLLLMFIFLISVLVFGVYGRISMTVSAFGIILPLEHIQHAEKVAEENLRDLKAKLFMLQNILEKKRILYKKHYLTITDLEKAEEEYLAAKNDFLNTANKNPNIERPVFDADAALHDQELVALVFVKNSEGKRILPGMETYVLPKNLSSYEYGYIKGRVVSVSAYPASRETAYSYLGNMSLVDEFFYNGSPFMVKIRLEKNSNTKSGLSWTTRGGSSFRIQAGTTVTAMIISKVSTPLGFLVHSEYE
jgi:hypothetical protein